MSLAPKGGKNKSLEDALYKEDKLAPALTSAAAAAQAQGSEPTPIQQNVHPITLAVAEKVSARLTRDGTLTAMDIKGSLTLHAADDAAGMCAVQLAVPESSQFFTFATHPKVNKAAWEQQGLLELKDKTKGFPSARPVGILRWTLAGAAEDLVSCRA
jgi:hypothetical protein